MVALTTMHEFMPEIHTCAVKGHRVCWHCAGGGIAVLHNLLLPGGYKWSLLCHEDGLWSFHKLFTGHAESSHWLSVAHVRCMYTGMFVHAQETWKLQVGCDNCSHGDASWLVWAGNLCQQSRPKHVADLQHPWHNLLGKLCAAVRGHEYAKGQGMYAQTQPASARYSQDVTICPPEDNCPLPSNLKGQGRSAAV